MRNVIALNRHNGKKIDRVIREFFPNVSSGMLYKALRKKDVKVNGNRVKEDYIVNAGDSIDIYIIDELLLGREEDGFSIIYDDENLIIANKAAGLPVHPDRNQKEATLIDKLQKKFGPDVALCHRLDRNTSGLIIAAKNQPSLDILLQKIKDKEIEKYYQCIVLGQMEKNQEELIAYHDKNEQISRVFISDVKTLGSQKIITRYKVIDTFQDTSLLEVELITGKTHQIRAHLAHVGHPIIGDGKYGTNIINKQYSAKCQLLCAYKLVFNFSTTAHHLNYLNNKSFEIKAPFDIRSIKKG